MYRFIRNALILFCILLNQLCTFDLCVSAVLFTDTMHKGAGQSPQTTQIYTHVSNEGLRNIHSPFDNLYKLYLFIMFENKTPKSSAYKPNRGAL